METALIARLRGEAPLRRPRVPSRFGGPLSPGSEGCILCEHMAPIVAKLGRDPAGKVDVQFIGSAKNPAAADKYRVQVIPTQVWLSSEGKELYRHTGGHAEQQILAKMRELEMLPGGAVGP